MVIAMHHRYFLSSFLSSAHNALKSQIVVSASSQSREPFCRRFGFPVFEGSDDLEMKNTEFNLNIVLIFCVAINL